MSKFSYGRSCDFAVWAARWIQIRHTTECVSTWLITDWRTGFDTPVDRGNAAVGCIQPVSGVLDVEKRAANAFLILVSRRALF